MAFCTTCGTQNQDNSLYCANCGSKMKGPDQQSTDTKPQYDQSSYVDKSQVSQNQGSQGQQYTYQQGYNQYGYQPGISGILAPRTGWLTFVIVMNWISVVILVLGGLFLFAFSAEFGSDAAFMQTIAIILLILSGLIYWLIKELNKYNNTARIIGIVLAVLGILGGLVPLNPLNLIISGLMLYALAFEKETIALFKPDRRFIR